MKLSQAFSTLVLLVALLPVHAAIPLQVEDQKVPSLAPMLERVTPGVVNIATRSKVVIRNPLLSDPFFRHFFKLPEQQRERRRQGLGSGVIVDARKGYIVTNHHVIAKAEDITVTLHDGRSFEAEVIGVDPEADIAVIQIKADKLMHIPIADSDKLRVGDFVVAIGNPFGLSQTVTSGIISGLGRSGLGIEAYEDFIQTDASINPGNSGGALVDLRGELVGINTAILGPSGGNIGIGFAIPINMANAIKAQLIKYGEVRRGRLGVVVQDLTPDLAKAFELDRTTGVVVARVEVGSPAHKAGLKAGDVVISVNGRSVQNSSQMRNVIGLLRVGAEVNLQMVRDGRTRFINAVIAEPKTESIRSKELSKRLAGAELGEIQEGSLLYGRVKGVVVLNVETGSAAHRAGLRKGDVIISVNKHRVQRLQDVKQALSASQHGILLNIQRGNGALFIIIK